MILRWLGTVLRLTSRLKNGPERDALDAIGREIAELRRIPMASRVAPS